MAKKIRTVVTLQLPAGKATPAPPVGTALGPHGINIVEFTKTYNEKTADKVGQVIPAQITIFEDRSFTFILKTPPADAVDLVKQTSTVKFDPSVEAHVRLGVDPRHADQMVRGTVVLPNGTGKVVRVAVFAQGEKAQEALRAVPSTWRIAASMSFALRSAIFVSAIWRS